MKVMPMVSALVWLQEQAARFQGRAAIVGKGPSFAGLDATATMAHRFVVALNEASLHTACHAAFIIDEDILVEHSARLAGPQMAAVITPKVVHRKRRSIGQLAIYGPVESSMEAPAWATALASKRHCFNLSTAEPAPELGEVVPAFNFSAPTLAHLLALAGFQDILLAGIDGGTAYSDAFLPFAYKKLKSVQSDFDAQFNDLRNVRKRFGTVFSSVRCREAHVLIGAEPEQGLADEVLRWSIDSRTFLTVAYRDPVHGERALYASGQAGTPFSFQRLFLPELASHRGRGIYFDSDMLVFKDVYELFNWDMQDNVLAACLPTPGRKPQFSVFLVDNERATWDARQVLAEYNAGQRSYVEIMGNFCFAQPQTRSLPRQWNSLELFEQGQTANLHFTDMGTQPWLSIYNPNARLWCEALFAALRERPAVAQALEQSLDRGWVRPSLRWQVEHDHDNPWTLPRAIKQADANWLPPHALARAEGKRSLAMLKWRLASRVRRAMQSRTYIRLVKARQALAKIV